MQKQEMHSLPHYPAFSLTNEGEVDCAASVQVQLWRSAELHNRPHLVDGVQGGGLLKVRSFVPLFGDRLQGTEETLEADLAFVTPGLQGLPKI